MNARSSAALALALLQLEGVGRVACGRLVSRFPDLETLRSTPREQIRLRLPGIPGADAIVSRLFDESFDHFLREAEETLVDLESKQVEVLTIHHPHWPEGLDDLSFSERPVVLYAYGQTALLRKPTVAFLAKPPLEEDPYELAQKFIRTLMAWGITPICGLQTGFDTVTCKLAAANHSGAIAVISAGLSKAPTEMRPAAAAMTRTGGLLLSPFPMQHGPFPHDDGERARLMTSIAGATVFVGADDEGAPECRALKWAIENHRPAFSLVCEDDVPFISGESEFEGVISAVREGMS